MIIRNAPQVRLPVAISRHPLVSLATKIPPVAAMSSSERLSSR
jgi:hypothetical protein